MCPITTWKLNPAVHLFTIETAARVGDTSSVSAPAAATRRRTAATATPAGALAIDAAVLADHPRGVQRGDVASRQDHRLREAGARGVDERLGEPDDASQRRVELSQGALPSACLGGAAEDEEAEGADGEAFLREALAKPLEELELPARAISALKKRRAEPGVDLVQKSEPTWSTSRTWATSRSTRSRRR